MKTDNGAPSPEEFFSKYSRDYATNDNFAHGSDLSRLIQLLQPRKIEVALDVATGTGFTAMEIAKNVKQVVAVDITNEMLLEAERLAKENGFNNIRFVRADASNLPVEGTSFDIVTTRRAAHHFSDISSFLREASRVLRPSGRLGIVDMSPPEGTEEFFNRIEKLRDSTHTRALTQREWEIKLAETDLSIEHLESLGERIGFERWLYPVRMGGKEEKEIRDEWKKAPLEIREALEAREKEGRIEGFVKTRIILVAKKNAIPITK